METTKTPHNLPPQELILDTASRALLLSISKWSNFLAIIAFVFIGLLLLVFGYKAVQSRLIGEDSMAMTFSLLYKPLLIFPPALYLFHFSNKMKNAINIHNQESIAASLASLESFFRFIVIVATIIIVVGTIGIFIIGDGLSQL